MPAISIPTCIIRKEQSSAGSGYDTITLSVPDQGKDFGPNFRIGDMVYLYTYKLKEKNPM